MEEPGIPVIGLYERAVVNSNLLLSSSRRWRGILNCVIGDSIVLDSGGCGVVPVGLSAKADGTRYSTEIDLMGQYSALDWRI